MLHDWHCQEQMACSDCVAPLEGQEKEPIVPELYYAGRRGTQVSSSGVALSRFTGVCLCMATEMNYVTNKSRLIISDKLRYCDG